MVKRVPFFMTRRTILCKNVEKDKAIHRESYNQNELENGKETQQGILCRRIWIQSIPGETMSPERNANAVQYFNLPYVLL